MKYIKTFEDTKFKSGDYVYAIDTASTLLEKDRRYQIKNTIHSMEFRLDGQRVSGNGFILEELPNKFYLSKRFISELDYNTKNYNL